MQEMAAGILYALACGTQQNREAVAATEAVPLLVALLRCDKSDVPLCVALALSALAHGSQQNKDEVIAAGAVPLLIVLLRSDHRVVQEHAADALGQLANNARSTTRISLRQWALCLRLLPCKGQRKVMYNMQH